VKLCRFLYQEKVYDGGLSDGSVEAAGRSFNLGEVKLLPPTTPSKVVCVGLNYTDHARELAMDIPEEPIIFLKPPTTVIGHGDRIIYPSQSTRVDYEAELAVVIGKKCRHVPKEDAYDYILGYSCFNDVTARDLQRRDGQWTRAKSFDTFAPYGPWIVTTDEIPDPGNLGITLRLNGEVKQDSSTGNLIFDIPTLVEFISGIMTLEKGDVIATGTPPGVGPMERGDSVEVEIGGIGTLENILG
jgi:4-hydroxyphenylacetate degradation bifunctional isomerase/decarboxylase decarboxylase subunit